MFEYIQIVAQAKPGGGDIVSMLLPFALIFVVFYFIMWRPQSKQREAQQKLLAALTVGDEIVTAGGIIGTIKSIDDPIVTIEISKGTKMKVLRNRIKGTKSSVLKTGAEKSAE